MTQEEYNIHINKLQENCKSILQNRNNIYGPTNPAHNFEAGAQVMGCTPAQTAFSYMVKHLVALRDKIEKNDFRNAEDLLEKCTDITNYIAIIYALGMHTRKLYTQNGDDTNEYRTRPGCKNADSGTQL